MRKVRFKKYIQPVYRNEQGEVVERFKGGKQEPGTGCFETEFINDGYFHCWGQYGEGNDQETLGVIECADGTIETVSTSRFIFIEPYAQQVMPEKEKSRYDYMDEQKYILQCQQSIELLNCYNFERWPAFQKVHQLALQDEMAAACRIFTVEPIIVTNSQIFFMQRKTQTVMQFDGQTGNFSIYGSSTPLAQNMAVRHIFEKFFNLL